MNRKTVIVLKIAFVIFCTATLASIVDSSGYKNWSYFIDLLTGMYLGKYLTEFHNKNIRPQVITIEITGEEQMDFFESLQQENDKLIFVYKLKTK